MIELKLVTAYYISINYHTEALEMMKGTGVAAHEPGRQTASEYKRTSKKTKIKHYIDHLHGAPPRPDAGPAHACSAGSDSSLSCNDH